MCRSPNNSFFVCCVKDFISDYFAMLDGCQVADEKQKNILTLSVLSILSRLVAFGFYSCRADIMNLCHPMISSLDGRADKMTRDGQARRIVVVVRRVVIVGDHPCRRAIDVPFTDRNPVPPGEGGWIGW